MLSRLIAYQTFACDSFYPIGIFDFALTLSLALHDKLDFKLNVITSFEKLCNTYPIICLRNLIDNIACLRLFSNGLHH